ncbi:tyrosine-type recombinase/integrase [Amycolatopsis sp. CA-230715]|uniref:tyrosine-type recombinase/integrase n=1 Tax=Amycolatopsis sp. CA-230715 TaxID=2745196 RepID=UPI001C00F34E|nr:tyrosine-type recombinase/integrase [Amycolatopsis sp. CA-230715]QWF80170.1 Tyrosine recombinase XerC [Amycolatopsis sp. CA-230715]
MRHDYKYAPGEWGTLGREWRRSLEADNKSDNTVRIYLGVLCQLGTWAMALDEPYEPTEIPTSALRDYVKKVLDATSPGNAHNQFRTMRTFFNWLVTEEEIGRSPMATMKAPHYEPPDVPILYQDMMGALLETCPGRDFVDRRDNAILRCLWATAGRRREVSVLNLDDVDQDYDELKVFGKGRRFRTIPYGAKTGQAIARYLRVRNRHPQAALPALWLGATGQGGITPEGVRAIVARRATQAGIGHVHPHMFRHAYAHYWQLEGGNENDLMRIMGWKSREMLGRYGSSAASERAHKSAREMAIGDRV